MTVLLTHTDLRLYWVPRIAALAQSLAGSGYALSVAEVAGRGSPCSFAGDARQTCTGPEWTCLFPDKTVERIPTRRAAATLYHELDRQMPDVVVAGAQAYASGVSAIRWARTRRRPVVIMDNVRRIDAPRPFCVDWVKRRFYANVDALLVPAASHRADFEHWGVPAASIFFGLNASDNAFFAGRAAAARQDTAARQRLRPPPRYLLDVGRQVE